MPVNWGLGLQQGPNAGEAFANSFQQGQEQNRQNTARNAMAALVQDPNNQRALQALAQVDPQSAQQFQQQKLEMARQQMGQHYDNVLKGAQLIRQMQPKDDASWQRFSKRRTRRASTLVRSRSTTIRSTSERCSTSRCVQAAAGKRHSEHPVSGGRRRSSVRQAHTSGPPACCSQ
jgi:hypothetical protein